MCHQDSRRASAPRQAPAAHNPIPGNSLKPRGGWTVRTPAALDVSAIPPTHLKMIFVLETFWRDRTYCFPSNATLAAAYGYDLSRPGSKVPGSFHRLLRDLERDGWIYRLPVNPGNPSDGRAGIFCHRRLDPDLPVEDVPPPPEAVARLWAARGWEGKGDAAAPKRAKDPRPFERTTFAQKGGGGFAQKGVHNKDEGPNQDEVNNDEHKERASSSSLSSEGKTRMEDAATPSPAESKLEAEVCELAAAIRRFLPDTSHGQVRRLLEEYGAERTRKVIRQIEARRKRERSWKPDGFGYFWKTLEGMKRERGEWRPPAAGESEVQPAVAEPDPFAALSAEERLAAAANLLDVVRRGGIGFRWDESAGGYFPIKVQSGADVSSHKMLAPLSQEVRVILDRERAAPGWENPAPWNQESVAPRPVQEVPAEVNQAEGAEAERRTRKAADLLERAGRLYFAVQRVESKWGPVLDLIDAFPADLDPDSERAKRARMNRPAVRRTLMSQLTELAPEVRALLAQQEGMRHA